MNKQELIKHFEDLPYVSVSQMGKKAFIDLIEQLDEPHDNPIKLKDVIKRIKDLDIDDREAWLNEILNKLGSDFGLKKYRDGYEQGKVEGLIEREKPVVPQFVANWIANVKRNGFKFRNSSRFHEEIVSSDDVYRVMYYILRENIAGEAIRIWVNANRDTFARAWLDGYTVEKEKRYLVKIVGMDNINGYLSYNKKLKKWFFGIASESRPYRSKHTRKELEDAGFGEVFNCPLFEIEEVEE